MANLKGALVANLKGALKGAGAPVQLPSNAPPHRVEGLQRLALHVGLEFRAFPVFECVPDKELPGRGRRVGVLRFRV